MALGACLLFPGGSDAASPPGPVRLVYESTEFVPVGFSSGGGYAIAARPTSPGGQLISMLDGSVSPNALLGAVATANGAFIFGHTGGQTIDRHDVRSRITTSLSVPFGGPLPNWSIMSITGADDAGRFVLFRAENSSMARTSAFLFDFETATLVPSNGDAISGDVMNTVPQSISRDGNILVYTEFRDASVPVVRWDRSTDTRTEYLSPSEFDPGRTGWSPSFEWQVFNSRDPDVLPGLDASERFYRRNPSSGFIEVVPIDPEDVRGIDIYEGGRVVMRVVAPTAQSANPHHAAQQLFFSDPGQPARQISVQSDGAPPDYWVGQFVAPNVDATSISFTASGGIGRRWYVAEIPAAIARIDGPTTATATAIRCSQSALC